MPRRLLEKNTPRWIIFTIDVCICLLSLLLAYVVRFNFKIPDIEIERWIYAFPAVIGVRIASFLITRIYKGIIRYTNTRDATRVFFTITAGSAFLALLNIPVYFLVGIYLVPYSIIIIEYFSTVFLLTAFRIFVKTIYNEIKNPSRTKKQVIIYGAGESGLITKRALDRDAGTRYKILAFVDDDKAKVGKTLEGIRIYNATTDLEELIRSNSIENLIISIQNISGAVKQDIIEKCLGLNVNILNVPPVNNWINGQLSFNQIKKVRIEDLLERDPIKLDHKKIAEQLKGKTILISGGAGSIGAEIVRQLIPFSPGLLVVLDQAESPLYELELEISEKYGWNKIETVIGDVRQMDRMKRVFDAFKPQIVFHAAAYKHVPVMENNPSEAILTNVHGTKILADLSLQFGIEKFVMVSTDKAVNPTSIMGATKRIAEIYCQSMNSKGKTKYITTRFGNVLDSNGSVIPRFKKQIEEGGPLTVTHPEVTRYFMTIPEACQLVLEAGTMGNGGEIFIFDMGKRVKIADLAKKMIRLSGLEPDKDIQIIFTGLRAGEKIYEELLADKETTIPTHHEKIMIARVQECNFESVQKQISDLIEMFRTQNNDAIVRKVKEIVPEYVSANSEFEKLDIRST
ncbi:MAG: polysaccharide biosynthesis protein [Bacteroidetes bacterium]|nr:MAG: polysaccharide biosynthesis protein [Bacteroidota bacterium]REK06997.1 MAG: polysaccharide biosynthesis protein [Bacteroidota bacterium]REK33656.1 MAG: polysaccharide biosynthesis protein [Bacteroidota bacterium]REK48642.1 MAG: polysaccharide biosynthesis protein [Bacteroidota bacterium]